MKDAKSSGFECDISLDAALCAVRKRQHDDDVTEEDERMLWRSESFLMARMGERQAALEILVGKIKSVQESMDFIFEEDDEELFETLIQRCIQGGAKFIGDLLEHIGSAPEQINSRPIEPIEVFRRIPADMQIPDLKRRLVKIIRDKALNAYLKEDCLRVLRRDVHNLEDSLCRSRSRAIAVRVEPQFRSCCMLCEQALQGVPVTWVGSGDSLRAVFAKSGGIDNARNYPQGIVLFWCSHSWHLDCYFKASGRGELPEKPGVCVRRDRRGNVRLQSGEDDTVDPFALGARVTFNEVKPGMTVRMTPEGCIPDCDFYIGVVLRKDAERVLMRWHDHSNGGPPPEEGIPSERPERRGWWDGGTDGGQPHRHQEPHCLVCRSALPQGAKRDRVRAQQRGQADRSLR